MRKNIDLPKETVKALKILAAEKELDVKNYIQDILIEHARIEGDEFFRYMNKRNKK